MPRICVGSPSSIRIASWNTTRLRAYARMRWRVSAKCCSVPTWWMKPAARRRDPDFGTMLASVGRGGTASGAQLGVAMDDGRALQPVDAVSGALMLMSRGLFDRLQGFDSGYRLHAEDLDLCRRAREGGALVAVANARTRRGYAPRVRRSRPFFVEWHKHRGLWRYFSKFEAQRRSSFTRCAVFAAIWGRFPFAVLRALRRR
jgi:N-acetylglucosaminyl-diphospho-decaprenol L-rhamnosyltransferase